MAYLNVNVRDYSPEDFVEMGHEITSREVTRALRKAGKKTNDPRKVKRTKQKLTRAGVLD